MAPKPGNEETDSANALSVEQLTSFIPPQMAAAVLAGLTVFFGGIAIRRLARKG